MFENIYKDKKVLVTGHTGFKGAWLSQWLTLLGSEVAGLSLSIPTQPSPYEVMGLDKVLSVDCRGDVKNIDDVKKIAEEFQPEILFHLAAQPIVRASYEDPIDTFHTNAIGMANVLEVTRHIPSIKVAVLITTDKCYENVEWEHGYRETDGLGGKDPYSASKACAEIIFSSYFRSFFNEEGRAYMATARAGNVIGGGDWSEYRIVPDCVKAWSNNDSVSIRNPKSTRPWQHVLDSLSGYLHLGAQLYKKKKMLNGEAFNFGPKSSVGQSVVELVETMNSVWPVGKWELVKGEPGKPEASSLKLSTDKALNRLGWEPTLDFEEAIITTAKWYMEYYENKDSDMRGFTSNQISEYQDIATKRGRVWAI